MDVRIFVIKRLVKISPWTFLISAIKEIGWDVAFEKDKEMIDGLIIGTKDFMKKYVPEEDK